MCFNEDKELQLPNGLMQGTYKKKKICSNLVEKMQKKAYGLYLLNKKATNLCLRLYS